MKMRAAATKNNIASDPCPLLALHHSTVKKRETGTPEQIQLKQLPAAKLLSLDQGLKKKPTKVHFQHPIVFFSSLTRCCSFLQNTVTFWLFEGWGVYGDGSGRPGVGCWTKLDRT